VTTKDISIGQAETFRMTVRWGTDPLIFVPITKIAQSAPAKVTAPSHGILPGWPVAVSAVAGMTDINASSTPPKPKDYHPAVVIDADTVTLTDLNAAGFSAYTGGGVLQYQTPVPLVGYTAKMSIKDKIGGAELYRLDTLSSKIVLDSTAYTITLNIPASDTTGFTWSKGVYDLKLVSAAGVVTTLLSGAVTVVAEVTQ
jgi:hypothetical protein